MKNLIRDQEAIFLALIWNHLGYILMVRKNGLWMLPGGHWDPVTKLFGTCESELFEEVNLTSGCFDPKRLRIVKSHSCNSETHKEKGRIYLITQFNYYGRQFKVGLGPRANEENIDAVAWIKAADVLNGAVAVGEAVALVMPDAVEAKNNYSQPTPTLPIDDDGDPQQGTLFDMLGLEVVEEEKR